MIKKNLYIVYLIIVGIFIIFFQLFLRIFRSKDEVSLNVLKEQVSYINILLLSVFCIIQLVVFFSLILYFYKKYNGLQQRSKIIENLSKVVKKIYWEPLEYIYEKFANFFPGIIFVIITENIRKGNTVFKEKLYYNSFWLFCFFPQIIVSIVFLFEIVYYKKIHYFFYGLLFLLIPIIYELFIKFSLTFAERSLPDFYEYLNIYGFEIDNKGVYTRFEFSWKPEYGYNSKDLLEKNVNDFFMLQSLEINGKEVKKRKEFYYPYILLITTIIYLVGGFYRLYFIIL